MAIDTVIMDGKIVAEQIYSDITLELRDNPPSRKPKLAVVLIGNNASSLVYIKQKMAACEKLEFGYLLDHQENSDHLSTDDVVALVEKYNEDDSVTGLIVQMPLPEHIDKQAVIAAINPQKDVDGLSPQNMGKTFLGKEFEKLSPCTANGIMKMLEYYKVSLVGKKAVVIGTGLVAGRPIAAMLINRRATVTVCNSKTPDLAEYTLGADIVLVAVGSAELLKADMVKEGVVVVDVGISKDSQGKIIGDTEFSKLLGKAAFISPVPGGVGKLTVACLMENLLKSAFENVD